MKIYNEVRMDLDGNVVYEDSFWHEGEVAMCMGGGEAPSVSYAQSPEQRQMYALLAPMMRAMSRRAMNPIQMYPGAGAQSSAGGGGGGMRSMAGGPGGVPGMGTQMGGMGGPPLIRSPQQQGQNPMGQIDPIQMIMQMLMRQG